MSFLRDVLPALTRAGCSSGGCDGGFTEDAGAYFVKTGLVTGDNNPAVGSGSSCFPYQLKQVRCRATCRRRIYASAH